MKIKKPGRPPTEIQLEGECARCGLEIEVTQAEAKALSDLGIQGVVWAVRCPGCAGVITVRDKEED
jgi:hypothetical protein